LDNFNKKIKQFNTDIDLSKVLTYSFLVSLVFSLFGNVNPALIVLVLVLSMINVIKVRKNLILLIIFLLIFYLNYSICILNYADTKNYIFTIYRADFIGKLSLMILVFFTYMMYRFISKLKINKFDESRLFSKIQISKIFHFAIMLLVVLIMIFGYTFDTFGQRGHYSTFFGYIVFLILFGIYFSNKDRVILSCYLILSIVYMIQNLIFGERLYVIQLVIILFIYYCPKKIKSKSWILAIAALFGYLGLTAVGIYRSYDINFGLLIYRTIKDSFINLFALDTSCAAYFAGQTFVESALIDPFYKQLFMFFMFVLSILLGGSMFPEYNLSEYTKSVRYHFGGGTIFNYAYYYLGIIGVTLLAWYLCYLFKKINNNKGKNPLWDVLTILICSTTFSWYLYSPSSITRGLLIGIVLYYAIIFTEKIYKKLINKIKKRGSHG